MTEPARAVRWRIEGRVQGVSFRWHTQQAAQRAGVAGWVRNRFDGSVEVVAQGDDAALEALHAAVRRGPPTGRVDRLVETEESVDPDHDDGVFRILPTA